MAGQRGTGGIDELPRLGAEAVAQVELHQIGKRRVVLAVEFAFQALHQRAAGMGEVAAAGLSQEIERF